MQAKFFGKQEAKATLPHMRSRMVHCPAIPGGPAGWIFRIREGEDAEREVKQRIDLMKMLGHEVDTRKALACALRVCVIDEDDSPAFQSMDHALNFLDRHTPEIGELIEALQHAAEGANDPVIVELLASEGQQP